MADAKELAKLNRSQLNQLATEFGIEDAANEEKFVTKADLVKELEDKVSVEDVEAARVGATEAPKEVEPPVEQDEKTAEVVQPTPPPIDSPEDVDDQSGTEVLPTKKEEVAEEEPVPVSSAGAPPESDPGMGFPMKGGKTVDIFDSKTPHTHIRNVAGIMVPLTQENYEQKTDGDIMKVLKKLGKI